MEMSMPRIQNVVASLAIALIASGAALAGEPHQKSRLAGKCSHAQNCGKCGDGCATGGHGCTDRGCRRCKHHQLYDGQEPWANCGCNGSYNYPVPPLYTYHWRGMASQRLMTNYQSPYRFPAIKPFEDEDTADDTAEREPVPSYRNAAHRNAPQQPPRRVRLSPRRLDEKVAATLPPKKAEPTEFKAIALKQTVVGDSANSVQPRKATKITTSRVPLRTFIR
jgi:hypothetical protein